MTKKGILTTVSSILKLINSIFHYKNHIFEDKNNIFLIGLICFYIAIHKRTGLNKCNL